MWSAYCKTLAKEVLYGGKAVVCPVFGVFTQLKNLSMTMMMGGDRGPNKDDPLVYIPSQLMAASKTFSHEAKLPHNIPFASLDQIKSTQMFKTGTLVRIPFGNMAKLVDTSEQSIVFVLKQILMCVDHTMETGYTSKLNLRIGFLKFANGQFKFVNNNEGAGDAASEATSCNTEYRTNKRYLTNLRERPNGGFD